ncbi:MAG: CmcJ/NvfI family oxidoreductase [Noviherbaspirillum sp.]
MDIRARNTHVVAELNYVSPPASRLYNYMYDPGPGTAPTNCRYDPRQCAISDARQAAMDPCLEVQGFQLSEVPTAVADFDDSIQIRDIYYPEVERLVRDLAGGTRAIVFDHQLRQREAGRPALTFGRHGDGSKPAAVGRVHNDYSERSGRRRLQMLLPSVDPHTPFLILNLWRPVLYPAIDTPLAVCDARTVKSGDWVETDIIYPARTGEIYQARYSPDHRWSYYPEMTPQEVLVFKTFDSRAGNPGRMVPHCAFDDPTAPADAPPRRSIEIRCLVTLA